MMLTPEFLNPNAFPNQLRERIPTLKQLYVLTENQELLHKRVVSIVGSRKMSPYGAQCVREVLEVLSKYDLVVTSGFVAGVDSCVHTNCVRLKIPTIAILGYGLGKLSLVDQPMAQDIIRTGGAVVSEYALDQKAQKWTFVRRNRIIAALSFITIVIEAAKKSGALITAHHSMSYDNHLIAFPGSVFSPLSQGTNALIRDRKAVLYDRELLLDLLSKSKVLSYNNEESITVVPGASPESDYTVLQALLSGPHSIDSLSIILDLPLIRLKSILAKMELRGLVTNKEGFYYAL